MAYGKSKDLAKTTQSDKPLRDKTFKIVSDPKYDGYQSSFASVRYTFFDKNSSGSGVDAEPNYQLAMNFIRRLLENLREKGFIRHLETIFGVLIWLICNH